MKLTRREIAEACGGRVVGNEAEFVTGASTDSRDAHSDQLFVPIVAERDGHDFIETARGNGVHTWLTRETHESATADGAIVVSDTTGALQALGAAVRTRISSLVVGVTGSVGKTSTKDLIGAVLRQRGPSIVSAKSFNNELGVPLTLINGPDDSWASVIEMGARGRGHVAMLCGIAKPTVGVITNVGTAHLEMFGSREGIADAKSEIISGLPTDGTAVLNLDSDLYARMASHASTRIHSFSASGNDSAAAFARNVSLNDDLQATFDLVLHGQVLRVTLGARGEHQVANACSAALACHAVGVTNDELIAGLATTELSPMRMELVHLDNGALVINDAYNANPVSMKAAVDSLVAKRATRRIAFLGPMAELGDDRDAMHRDVALYASQRGVDIVCSVGESAYNSEAAVDDIAGAAAFATSLGLVAGDVILVKGSRVAALEQLVQLLRQEANT